MKLGKLSARTALIAIITMWANSAFAEQSKRGLFEGNLPSGGGVVFFVQGNHAISAYLFDAVAHQASFGGAAVAANGTFTIAAFPSDTISGTVGLNSISAVAAGQNVTAARLAIFGPSDDVGGRFSGNALARSGSSFDARFLFDSQGRIFFMGT